MKTVHGWAFPDADEFMATEMKPDGSYQAGHLRIALSYVTEWSVAIDGGAHVGTWSRLLSQRFARVIAVEPSADTREALLVNLAAFGCRNVEVRGVALGDTAGRVHMTLDAGSRAERMKNTGARHVVDGGDVPMERIDDWHLESLGLLKLDVEGSEPRAIRGALNTLQRCRPIVIYEEKGFGRRYGDTPGAAARALESIGYRLLTTVKMDHVWGPPS